MLIRSSLSTCKDNDREPYSNGSLIASSPLWCCCVSCRLWHRLPGTGIEDHPLQGTCAMSVHKQLQRALGWCAYGKHWRGLASWCHTCLRRNHGIEVSLFRTLRHIFFWNKWENDPNGSFVQKIIMFTIHLWCYGWLDHWRHHHTLYHSYCARKQRCACAKINNNKGQKVNKNIKPYYINN